MFVCNEMLYKQPRDNKFRQKQNRAHALWFLFYQYKRLYVFMAV